MPKVDLLKVLPKFEGDTSQADVSFGDAAGAAFGAGVTGLRGNISNAVGGAVEPFSSELARSFYDQGAQAAQEAQQQTLGTQRIEDVHGLRDFGSYMGNLVGGSLPSMGALALGAGAAALTRGRISPLAGGVLATAPAYVGEQIGTQQADLTVRDQPWADRMSVAAPVGVGQSLLESVVPAKIGGQMLGHGAGISLRQVPGALLKNGAEEATTEVFGGELQRQGHGLLNPNRDTSGDASARLNEAVGGMLLGGPLSAPGVAVDAVKGSAQDIGAAAQQGIELAKKGAGAAGDFAKGMLNRGQEQAQTGIALAPDFIQKVKDGALDLPDTVKTKAQEWASNLSPENQERLQALHAKVNGLMGQVQQWAGELQKAAAPKFNDLAAKGQAFLNENLPDNVKAQIKALTDAMANPDRKVGVQVTKKLAQDAYTALRDANYADLMPAAKKGAQSVADKAKALMKDGKDITLKALASGKREYDNVLGDMTPEQALPHINEQDAADAKMLHELATEQLQAQGLGEEHRAQIESALKEAQSAVAGSPEYSTKQKALAGMIVAGRGIKKAFDATDDFIAKMREKASASESKASLQAAPGSEGLKHVIAQELVPFLQQHNPGFLENPAAVNKLAEGLRVAMTARTAGNVDTDTIDYLRSVFGGAAGRLVDTIRSKVAPDDEEMLKLVNDVEEAGSAQGKDVQTVEKYIDAKMAEQHDITAREMNKIGELIRAHLDESGYEGLSPEGRRKATREFDQWLDQFFGKNKAKVLAAFEKGMKTARAAQRDVGRDKPRDQYAEGEDDSELEAEDRIGEEIDADERYSGRMQERDSEDIFDKPRYFGRGSDDHPDLVLSTDTLKSIYGRTSGTETHALLDRAAREHPENEISFVSAQDLGDHPAVQKARRTLAKKRAQAEAAHDAKYEQDVAGRAEALFKQLAAEADARRRSGGMAAKTEASLRAEADAMARGMMPKPAFVPTADLDINNYGLVRAYGSKPETGVLTKDEIDAMRFDNRNLAKKGNERSSRIDTGSVKEGGIGLIDAHKVAQLGRRVMPKVDYTENHAQRLVRGFAEGLARVMEHTGKSFPIDPNTLVGRIDGRPVTVAELMKVPMGERTQEATDMEAALEDMTAAQVAGAMGKITAQIEKKITAAVAKYQQDNPNANQRQINEYERKVERAMRDSPLAAMFDEAAKMYARKDREGTKSRILQNDFTGADGGIYDMGKVRRREAEGMATAADLVDDKVLTQFFLNRAAAETENTLGDKKGSIGRRIVAGRQLIDKIEHMLKGEEDKDVRADLASKLNTYRSIVFSLMEREARMMDDAKVNSKTDLSPDTDVITAAAFFNSRDRDSEVPGFAAWKKSDPQYAMGRKGLDKTTPDQYDERFEAQLAKLGERNTPQRWVERIRALDAKASKEDVQMLRAEVVMAKKPSDFAGTVIGLERKYENASAPPRTEEDDEPSIWGSAKKSEAAAAYGKQLAATRAGTGKVSPQDRRSARDYVQKVLGPQALVRFTTLFNAAGFEYSGEYQKTVAGQDLIRLSLHALDPMGVAYHESLHGFFRHMTEMKLPEVRRVLTQAAQSAPVLNQLKTLLANEPEALKQIESDPEERVAYMYQFWAAGALKVGEQTKTFFEKVKQFIFDMLGMWTNDRRAVEIMSYFHDGKFAPNMGDRSAVERALLQSGRNATFDKVAKALEPVMKIAEKVAATGDGRVRAMNIPPFTEIAKQILSYDTDHTDDPGWVVAQGAKFRQVLNEFYKRVGDITEDREVFAEALQALQLKTTATNPEAERVRRAVRVTLDHMKDYMEKAGVNVGDLGYKKDYFPVVWDIDYISKNQAAFVQMMEKYHRSGQLKERPEELMKRLIASDGNEYRITLQPGMQHIKERVLDFVDPKDREPFLNKDLFQTMASYVKQGTRRAEWTRRFGEDSVKIKQAMTQAAAQYGATPEQLQTFEDYIKSMDGSLGDDISPTTRRLFGNLIVYQNLRLLPLAVFSMAIDPGGILVRGGTMKDAWEAYKRGITEVKRNFQKHPGRDDAYKLAEDLGIIEDTALVHLMGTSYTQGMASGLAAKINDKLFRYNLVEQMNTSMRVAATAAAARFILRHKDGNFSAHSPRYLKELGLSPADIKTLPNGELALRADDFKALGMSDADATDAAVRMRGAMNKWVDGAVLRPNAAQKPIWMNDPRWALVAHLKQFVYSFQKVILRRVANEFKHGNYTPAYSLAAYVPVMAAADLARGLIVGAGSLPSWMAGWGMGDWLAHSMERAGLFGVGQFGVDAVQHTTGLLGPTVEQLGDGATMLGGGGAGAGKFVLDSLPANVLAKAAFVAHGAH